MSYKKFKKELNKIDNEEIKDFTIEVLKKLPDYYWTAEFENEFYEHNDSKLEITFVDHAKRLVGILEELLKLYNPNPILKDILISAALLHDGMYYGEDGLKYDEFHPLRIRGLIEDNDLHTEIKYPVYKGIMKAIEGHMGESSVNPNIKAKAGNPEYIFHEADYLASIDLYERSK